MHWQKALHCSPHRAFQEKQMNTALQIGSKWDRGQYEDNIYTCTEDNMNTWKEWHKSDIWVSTGKWLYQPKCNWWQNALNKHKNKREMPNSITKHQIYFNMQKMNALIFISDIKEIQIYNTTLNIICTLLNAGHFESFIVLPWCPFVETTQLSGCPLTWAGKLCIVPCINSRNYAST